MGSVHARGDTFLTFGLKALTETNTSRLATAIKSLRSYTSEVTARHRNWLWLVHISMQDLIWR
jgi:hypothetical protein